MLSQSTQSAARRLHAIGAIKIDAENGFKLALHDTNPLAPLSPFYVNLRTPENKGGPLEPQDVATIAEALIAAANERHLRFDAVAGIPRAGTPFARHIARQLQIPYICLIKRSKTSRSMRVRTSAELHEKRLRILLTDDLITEATTKELAVRVLKRAGYSIAGIAVYLDREQGGVQSLQSKGITVVCVLKFNEVLSFYERAQLINATDAAKIRKYLQR